MQVKIYRVSRPPYQDEILDLPCRLNEGKSRENKSTPSSVLRSYELNAPILVLELSIIKVINIIT